MSAAQPSDGPPAGTLHHVELQVLDLAASLRFWEPFLGRLGYVPYQRWALGASFRLGHTYIVLVQTEAAHGVAGFHRKRAGLNHLAFHAASRAQVDDLTAWVRDAGFTVLYADRHPHADPGNYALFCEDPQRVKVEVIAPPGA